MAHSAKSDEGQRRAPPRRAEAAPPPDPTLREPVHQLLLQWYAAHQRDLPWRHTRDPYAVLVSEIMLQQTQVERVLPKYDAFLSRFPTLAALAAAPVAEVIRAWAPLGYNVRAVRLHQIARQTQAVAGGTLPDTLEGLLALKGIGRYTAGAVACFAYDQPVATVDTNIRRVLWRVFRGVEPAVWLAGQSATSAALHLAEWALPPGRAYDWQQALMDLGATICVSRQPACERCPLASRCAAFAEVGRVTLFPSGEALSRLRETRTAAAIGAAGPHERASVAETSATYVADAEPPARANRRNPAPQMRQADVPFTSSSRYFRGRVLAALRGLEPGAARTLDELGPVIKSDWTSANVPWLHAIVMGLARDGLVRVDAPADAAADASGAAIRVALP